MATTKIPLGHPDPIINAVIQINKDHPGNAYLGRQCIEPEFGLGKLY